MPFVYVRNPKGYVLRQRLHKREHDPRTVFADRAIAHFVLSTQPYRRASTFHHSFVGERHFRR
jgi:hypothetical protein